MLQNYELYLILIPTLTQEQVSQEITSVEELLKNELKASNINVDNEGLKKLAYPVQKHQTGYYVNVTFDVELGSTTNMKNVERKINLHDFVVRYMIVNQTEYLKQKSKEKRKEVEITNHRDLNKGKSKKKCVSLHMGLRVVDYKDTAYLSQFVSPYAKLFTREKTGSSAKFQRKITQAIKRARHMALLPFTPKHNA